jgi:hypothetical protein
MKRHVHGPGANWNTFSCIEFGLNFAKHIQADLGVGFCGEGPK